MFVRRFYFIFFVEQEILEQEIRIAAIYTVANVLTQLNFSPSSIDLFVECC